MPPIERELENVEKVLVSVAKRLDEGMYPPDQVIIPPTSTTDGPRLITSCSWASSSFR